MRFFNASSRGAPLFSAHRRGFLPNASRSIRTDRFRVDPADRAPFRTLNTNARARQKLGPALRARHSRSAARGRGRGRRCSRLRRRLRGGFRARRLEHLLARHLPRLHVVHVGGRGRRRALVSKEKQRDQPGGCDEGAARRAPGRAPRARAFRRAPRLAAGRADDAFGAGDGEARRGETRGASSPGAAASGDAEGARTGVARVRRGASARDCEDHACREQIIKAPRNGTLARGKARRWDAARGARTSRTRRRASR